MAIRRQSGLRSRAFDVLLVLRVALTCYQYKAAAGLVRFQLDDRPCAEGTVVLSVLPPADAHQIGTKALIVD